MSASRLRDDPTLVDLRPDPMVDDFDDLPAPMPPVVPPPPPGHDLLDTLGPVEDLWDACAETVKHDFSEPHVDGVDRVIDEYLVLEHDGRFGDLPAPEQQRLIQDLDAEFVRR